MSESRRPHIAPGLVASVANRVPARLQRKLDRAPEVAESWDWSFQNDVCTVRVDDVCVRLVSKDGVLSENDDITCSCLLAGRCFHLLAVVSVLEIRGTPEVGNAPDTEALGQSPDDKPPAPYVPLTSAQTAAAEAMWDAGAAFVICGAKAAGTLTQSSLLHAIHHCRNHGLHRLANAGLRVVEGVRRLRADDPQARKEMVSADLTSLLDCAWQLRRSAHNADSALVGVARRQFHPLPALRASGLFCEPVLTRSGYAGVVTLLAEQDGRLSTLSSVRPGEGTQVTQAWKGGVELGNLSSSHREVARSGLFLQGGTRSDDGRLGGGRNARATLSRFASWTQGPAADRFDMPLADQVAAVFAAIAAGSKAPGHDLVFLRGEISGTVEAHPVLVLRDGLHVRLAPAHLDETLQFQHNLAVLRRCTALECCAIGRLDSAHEGEVHLLALESPQLRLPATWQGRVDCGLDRLQLRHLPLAQADETVAGTFPLDEPVGEVCGARSRLQPQPDDGLTAFRRHLHGIAVGGRQSLPTARLERLARDAARLEKTHQPAAAEFLNQLGAAVARTEQDVSGVRRTPIDSTLAACWLACALYELAALRCFQERVWLRACGPHLDPV